MKYRTKGINKWRLKYWSTGEFQVVKERLNDLDRKFGKGLGYCPPNNDLFRALDAINPERVRVALVGQDPYPDPLYSCGLAFSIPDGIKPYPPSLVNIFKEYSDDLGYDTPTSGDLTRWVEQGVLLWNVYPSVQKGKPGSHHWSEWEYLSKEVIEKLDANGVVFVFLGRKAQVFAKYCSQSKYIETSHPSPLGVHHGFFGSRIFSRTNDLLVNTGKQPINWRLP